nr:immunoglobulin heavy chain junction region [Macaca mulatta]MOX37804.1 immunoglobulin heavy chain junction region [Macaca mulatta]MOX37887.1 immunoglobulin heavy chain junction region [Macaca mulatta]MOX38166.1 immunoglobulin heavy chain junction region [Macaca mulatta]MOX38169.1 immunoglobulin heavy chain junction region [Macaca mulatta]
CARDEVSATRAIWHGLDSW